MQLKHTTLIFLKSKTMGMLFSTINVKKAVGYIFAKISAYANFMRKICQYILTGSLSREKEERGKN